MIALLGIVGGLLGGGLVGVGLFAD